MKFSKNILITILLIFSIWIQSVNANSWNYLENKQFSENQKEKILTNRWLFILYFNAIWEWIPETYKYIDLKFYWIVKWTVIYDALQKWVYLDLIKNKEINLKLDNNSTESLFAKMINDNFQLELEYKADTPLKLSYFLQAMQEIKDIQNVEITNKEEEQINNKYAIVNVSNFNILNDVFVRLKTLHYNWDEFKDTDLITWAIKWMSESTKDKYTTYFPPAEAKWFNDELAWEFEWIWAHVDMDKPWIIQIVSPLSGSPAEKSWIKPQDQIIQIDEYVVTEKTSLEEAVSKIKWKAWTSVKLKILRDSKEIEITVIREKITLKYVESSKLDNWDNYVKITTFWIWTAIAFSKAIEEIKINLWNKLIIDLRNNPGWSLDEVSDMLEYFVPKWESKVNIKYRSFITDMNAIWKYEYSLIWKKVVILMNNWSASASEIMAWTIKDYLQDNVKIIWEQSYWKWSVQSLDSYTDLSSFKYTVAKWFTWKTKTWIDWIWIKPDIENKLDEELIKKWTDTQLEFAKNFKF